ncbi:hypothetical protein [Acinetobacter sp. 243_ASPC]|uniref:hypothetical protein n=1 Tax=Acinetobacter sp. 243_ASPC TaxID=1579345 RepID=UPI000AA866E8|nr:hypothetical protein [Acinetobacter sp. 243_ASPC]
MGHMVVADTDKKKTESAPVLIDIPRMEKALASKRYLMPQGLSRDEMIQHILNTAKED